MKRNVLDALKVLEKEEPDMLMVIQERCCPGIDAVCGDQDCDQCWEEAMMGGKRNVTNATMELLERVFRSQKENDDYISDVADAMERLRVRNRPVDEIALRQAMEKYLRKVEAK
jgi:hypothetical protein